MAWCQFGLFSLLALDLAFRKYGWTAATKILVKEPLYLQSLASNAIHLERELTRRSSMVGGDRGMAFKIKSPILFQRLPLNILSGQISDWIMWRIFIFCIWYLQDPIRPYNISKACFECFNLISSTSCDRLSWLKIQPCNVGCWVPHGTFLIKYITFSKYLKNYILLLTFWDLKSVHFLAKFGHHTAIPTLLRYLTGCTQSYHNKSGLLRPKIGWEQNLADIFVVFCLMILDFTWKKGCVNWLQGEGLVARP